jgi:signal transduction histidine kinase
MELAGGRVSAHSEGIGQGASVRLTWPAAAADAAVQPAAGQETGS